MSDNMKIDRETLVKLITEILEVVLAEQDEPVPAQIDANTVLVGHDAVIKSLGLVTVIVELEQRLEEDHDLYVTLADERAVSRKHSPFRTIGTLADYVRTLAADEALAS